MKRLLAIVLVLALIFSIGVTAYAAEEEKKVPSPKKHISIDDLPGASDTVTDAGVTPATEKSEANVVPNANMSDAQKSALEKLLAAVTEAGYLPADSFFVVADGNAVVTIALDEDAVVFIGDEEGNIAKQISVKELDTSDGKSEIPVSGSCPVVIAKEK